MSVSPVFPDGVVVVHFNGAANENLSNMNSLRAL